MSLVQQALTSFGASSGNLAFPGSVTAGNGLFLEIAFAGITVTITGVTDTRGNTWLPAHVFQDNTGGAEQTVAIYYCHANGTGSCTVTASFSGTVAGQIGIQEHTAFTRGVEVDVTNHARAGASTVNHGSVTSTIAVALAVTCGRCSGTYGSPTVGDSFTALTYGNRRLAHYKILSSTGTFDCDLVFPDSEVFAGCIAVFYETPEIGNQPTIEAVTEDEATINQRGSLRVIGDDLDVQRLTYRFQVTDYPYDWVTSGEVKVVSAPTGGLTPFTVHPAPDGLGGLTWEGKRQTDDRCMQIFRGRGGILKKCSFEFGAREASIMQCNGQYVVRVYEIDNGILGDNIPLWQAGHVYAEGNIVLNPDTGNDAMQYAYVCVDPGTSGGSPPAFTEVEDDLISDGGVIWEAHRGAGPVNPATPVNTPTPGWIAQSTIYNYNPLALDPGVKVIEFPEDQQFRTELGKLYGASLDWWAGDDLEGNSIAVRCMYLSTDEGNAYIDGRSTANNGPRLTSDFFFGWWEEFVLIDVNSDEANSRITNVDLSSDPSPFLPDNTINFRLPRHSISVAGPHRWRANCYNEDGTSDWLDPLTINIIIEPAALAFKYMHFARMRS